MIALAYLFNIFIIESGFDATLIRAKFADPSFLFQSFMKAFTLAITIIVVAVPEGLPMMITVVLSSNVKRMLADNILVKKMVGIETAGSMNILFCDKTGTLTSGEHSVCAVIGADGNIYKNVSAFYVKSAAAAQLTAICAKYDNEVSWNGEKAVGGNSTERAIVYGFAKHFSSVPDYTVEKKLLFESKNKYTYACLANKEGKICVVKGAPERILPYVKYSIDKNGKRVPFESYAKLKGSILEMTESCMRLIAVAVCEKINGGKLEELTLCSVLCIKDAVRKESASCVERLRGAGVQVVMVTGDSIDTARAVAKECKIICGGKCSLCLEHDELEKMSDKELEKLLPDITVIARALPSDKSRLVRVAQTSKYVCGMTGDGINDAPALKSADVGFAMGNGSDIAKEAGDIVILDNNIKSISDTVLYGRTIFDSIKKFISFQLTMNFCALLMTFFGPMIGFDTPITVIQMLWINIIMDTLGGIAFAGEAACEYSMRQKPKERNAKILSRDSVIQIISLVVFSFSICLFFLLHPFFKQLFLYDTDPIFFYSGFFALFIFLGIMNSFNARTTRINMLSGLSKNKSFIFIMSAVACVQLLMIYFGGNVFRTAPLGAKQLFILLELSLLSVVLEFVRRVFCRLLRKKGK